MLFWVASFNWRTLQLSTLIFSVARLWVLSNLEVETCKAVTFFFLFQNHFIHSFILVQSFTKYVLDHNIQNIGNDRNVQSVPEKK